MRKEIKEKIRDALIELDNQYATIQSTCNEIERIIDTDMANTLVKPFLNFEGLLDAFDLEIRSKNKI